MRKLATEDLFNGMRLFKAADMKKEFADIMANAKGKTEKEVGIEMVYTIITKCSDKNFEKAFYDFVSAPLEVKPSEVAKMNPIKLIDALYEVADPQEWIDFFNRVRTLNVKSK